MRAGTGPKTLLARAESLDVGDRVAETAILELYSRESLAHAVGHKNESLPARRLVSKTVGEIWWLWRRARLGLTRQPSILSHKERPFEAASDHVRISSQGAFAIPYTWAKRGACHGLREMGPACDSAPVLGTRHDRDHGQTEIDKGSASGRKGCCGKHDE